MTILNLCSRNYRNWETTMLKKVSLAVLTAVGVFLMLAASGMAAQKKSVRDVHPTAEIHSTAEIHPTAILEGKVVVGAYTQIDAGTIITGNVIIGHHTLIRRNVTIHGSK